jgi:hypothetical protein
VGRLTGRIPTADAVRVYSVLRLLLDLADLKLRLQKWRCFYYVTSFGSCAVRSSGPG